MLPDRVSNPEPLSYESGALPIALRSPANLLSNPATKTKFKRARSKIRQPLKKWLSFSQQIAALNTVQKV